MNEYVFSEGNQEFKLKREENKTGNQKYANQLKNVLAGKKGQDFNLKIGIFFLNFHVKEH